MWCSFKFHVTTSVQGYQHAEHFGPACSTLAGGKQYCISLAAVLKYRTAYKIQIHPCCPSLLVASLKVKLESQCWRAMSSRGVAVICVYLWRVKLSTAEVAGLALGLTKLALCEVDRYWILQLLLLPLVSVFHYALKILPRIGSAFLLTFEAVLTPNTSVMVKVWRWSISVSSSWKK